MPQSFHRPVTSPAAPARGRLESGVEQSVVAGYAGRPLSVGAQTAVPVFPQVVCATQRQEDQATHHRPDGRYRSFGLGGGW